MDTDTLCTCQRKKCYEDWHRNPTDVLMEEVTLTIPRYALERAAHLLDLNDGPWSTPYRVLTPYLLNPKPDPSTPIEELKKPAHRPNGPYYPTGLLGGEYCVTDRHPWPCPTAQSFPDLQERKPPQNNAPWKFA